MKSDLVIIKMLKIINNFIRNNIIYLLFLEKEIQMPDENPSGNPSGISFFGNTQSRFKFD